MSPLLLQSSRRRRKVEYRDRQAERDRIARTIESFNHLSVSPCDNCLLFGSVCVMALPSVKVSSFKYSECVRLGRPCSFRSWPSLDRIRELCFDKIRIDEKERDELFRRLAEI